MSILESLVGFEKDRIPNIAFKVMSSCFKVRDLFGSPDKLLDQFELRESDIVVDYGCGPGRFVRRASSMVGPLGKVYAADIHELAIEAIQGLIEKYGLENVTPALIKGYSSGIDTGVADIVYALDMLHMVKEPNRLLSEINRITKIDGFLFIDDGHQKREMTINKIRGSKTFEIIEEKKRFVKCRPIKS